MLQVVVGSTSLLKIEAVRQACCELGLEAQVRGVSARSGVSAQPLGFEQIMLGALNRVLAAACDDSTAVAVGIENGVVLHRGRFCDVAAAAVKFGEAVEIIVDSDRSVVVPNYIMSEFALSETASNVTIGQVLHEHHPECDPYDPHSWLTHGRTSRVQLLTDLLITALKTLPKIF